MLPPVVAAAVGFCVVLALLKLAFPYIAPFLLGLSLAVLLDVPVSFLESKGWPRPVTSLVLVAAAFWRFQCWWVCSWLNSGRRSRPCWPWALWAVWPGSSQNMCCRCWREYPFASEWDFAGLFALPQVLLGWALAIPDLFLIWTLTALSAYFFLRDKRFLVKLVVQQLPRQGISMRQLYHDTSGALWHMIRVQLLLVLLSTGVSMVFFHFCSCLSPCFPAFSGFF